MSNNERIYRKVSLVYSLIVPNEMQNMVFVLIFADLIFIQWFDCEAILPKIALPPIITWKWNQVGIQ